MLDRTEFSQQIVFPVSWFLRPCMVSNNLDPDALRLGSAKKFGVRADDRLLCLDNNQAY